MILYEVTFTLSSFKEEYLVYADSMEAAIHDALIKLHIDYEGDPDPRAVSVVRKAHEEEVLNR